MSLKQPIGQKRLTNVALVKYKKKGKRFEIACYKNKVLNWRNGVEKTLDDVLQTTSVFQNVSKGVLAKQEDLQDVFGTTDEEKICIIILNEGDYQVSDKERDLEIDSLFKDVASVLAEKCVNPDTSRPYTISMLERALKDIHFSVDLKRNAKQQALEVLPRLKEKISIERARMRLKISIPKAAPSQADGELVDMLRRQDAIFESRDTSGAQTIRVCQVDPGCYRDIHNYVQQATGGTGQVEVVSLGVMEQGEAHSQFDAWGATESAAPAAPALRTQEGAFPHPAGETRQRVAGTTTREQTAAGPAGEEVVYPRGPVSGLPEEFESRRERFAELDALQEGWQVELRKRRGGSVVDAAFFAPNGEKAGSFAVARRAALQAHKKATE